MLTKGSIFCLIASGLIGVNTSIAWSQEPYLSEVRWFATNHCPTGWATADGTLLPIEGFATLFSLLGTTFGGDGRSTFALPDLRGRVTVGTGAGLGLTERQLGDRGGEESAPLYTGQLPPHTHALLAAPIPGNSNRVSNSALARPKGDDADGTDPKIDFYTNVDPTVPMDSKSISVTGGGQPLQKMPPYLVLRPCICLQGQYPSAQ